MTTTDSQRITDLIDEHLATWTEPDSDRRLGRVAACWAADGSLVDPPLDGHGHDGICAMMGAMQGQFPGHTFVRTSDVDAHHDTFRVGWELRGPDGTAVLAGIDVGLLAADGKLRRISGFFGSLTS